MAGPRNSGDGNGPTLLALFALIAVALGLVGLSAMVLPQILGFAVVICGFVVIGLLQYVVWGRWLPRDPVDDDDDV